MGCREKCEFEGTVLRWLDLLHFPIKAINSHLLQQQSWQCPVHFTPHFTPHRGLVFSCLLLSLGGSGLWTSLPPYCSAMLIQPLQVRDDLSGVSSSSGLAIVRWIYHRCISSFLKPGAQQAHLPYFTPSIPLVGCLVNSIISCWLPKFCLSMLSQTTPFAATWIPS